MLLWDSVVAITCMLEGRRSVVIVDETLLERVEPQVFESGMLD
jgi:hypothetical protein